MKKPLLETFLRIGGKSAIREDYRSALENTEILTALLIDPKHGKHVQEQFAHLFAGNPHLDEFVELMLDEHPDHQVQGRYRIPSMRSE